MNKKDWRRVRVVVEVPVSGEFSEKDLRWLVERAIQDGNMDHIMRIRAKGVAGGIQFGKTEVKSLTKVQASQKQNTTTLASLERRVRVLEENDNPHRRAGYD